MWENTKSIKDLRETRKRVDIAFRYFLRLSNERIQQYFMDRNFNSTGKKSTQEKDFQTSDLKIFFSYIKPHRKLFLIDMGLSLIVALIDLIFPYVSRQSMRTMLPNQMYRAFFIVMGIVLLSYLLKAFFQYLVTVIGHGMGTLVEADMRADLFAHMQKLSFSFFDRNRTGVLLARVTNDLFEIVELAHHGPENILTCSVTILGALIVLCAFDAGSGGRAACLPQLFHV